jgi:hypothetical protein
VGAQLEDLDLARGQQRLGELAAAADEELAELVGDPGTASA